ncbi:hypothetical protein BDP27DRAFT_225823 [Rhodocollybia butyracea]|uniref:Uncharacterized protein n=1 Tax=Rhodocollybia butyracea TaxID=206335 RepID=A0A9P5Q627_9AGAR|nr:hypothetical protein BDP27DRAFT_225823 [Rhodocollybia butyracea]
MNNYRFFTLLQNMSNLDFSTLSSLIHRILGAYSVAQLGSIATIFGITCYTFATKSRDRAREVGILGFLAMLPFGYKPIFLYCLLLVFFVAFFEGGVASSHVQPPQEVDGSSPHALSSQHVPEGKDIMIPIGRSDWSVNVRFQSSSSPHVSFPSYNFDIKTIDKNLDPNTRLGEVAFNYKRVPTLDSDSVVDGGAKFEPLGVQLEIVHRMHRSTTFYQLSLVKRNFMLSAEQIPRKLRKGGAGGQGWKIDCPGFKTFHKTIGDKVVPATVLCPYGCRNYRLFGISYRYCASSNPYHHSNPEKLDFRWRSLLRWGIRFAIPGPYEEVFMGSSQAS